MPESDDPEKDYIEVGRDPQGDWRWNRMTSIGEVLTAGGAAFGTRKAAIEHAELVFPDLEIRKVEETL